MVVEVAGRKVSVRYRRKPKKNPRLSKAEICNLLWKSEVRFILEELCIAKGVRGKSKRIMAKRLKDNLSTAELCDHVIAALKRRTLWRKSRL